MASLGRKLASTLVRLIVGNGRETDSGGSSTMRRQLTMSYPEWAQGKTTGGISEPARKFATENNIRFLSEFELETLAGHAIKKQ